MNQQYDMEQIAQDNGYVFSHKGCPCNGLPLIYRKVYENGAYELSLYTKRAFWRLNRNHYSIDNGTDNVLQEHLQKWD